MDKLIRLSSLLLLCLFTACESDQNVTEISGKVIDIETNVPVADAKLNLTVSEGLQMGEGYANPVNYSVRSNTQGSYTFIIPDNTKQTFFNVMPVKDGFVEVADKNILAYPLKQQQRNQHDITVAKGSYLKLTVNKNAKETADKELRLYISYTLDSNASPLQGQPIITEKINITPATISNNLIRGYYFKYTKTVHLQWVVTTNGDDTTSEAFNQSLNLIEHDTAQVDINY